MGSNEAVQSSEPIVKGPGDAGGVSFDDLEGIAESSQNSTPEADLDNKAEKEVAEVKDVESVEHKPLEKLAKAAKDSKEKSAEEKALSDKSKSFKYKVGDVEAALPLEATVEVSVRGKKEFVKLQDLTAEFSGKTDWNRKYSELNTERQDFKKQENILQSYVNELYSTMIENKDAEGAVYLLAEAMGGNPENVMAEFRKQLYEKYDALRDLTPEERKVKELEEQIALRQRRDESTTKARSAQREASEVESRTQSVLEKYGMDKDKFVSYYHELKEKVPSDKLTPERIGEYHQTLERWDALSSTLDGVNSDLGDKKDGAIEELLTLWDKHLDFSVQDIKDIAIEVYGSKGSKNLAKKLKKSVPTQTAKPARTDNPVSWDDVD